MRVVVVDDHPVFRAGMVMILDDLDEVEVVGQACDGATALETVAALRAGARGYLLKEADGRTCAVRWSGWRTRSGRPGWRSSRRSARVPRS